MPTLFTLREYINATLDRNYNRAARPMIKQIAQLAKGQGSAVQAVLRELEAEAERLQDEGVRMKPDNPVLLKTLDTIEGEMVATQNMILANGDKIEASGKRIAPVTIAAKLFSAVTVALIAANINPLASDGKYKEAITQTGGNFAWPRSLAFVQSFVESEAWINRMEGWGTGYADLIGDSLKKGVQQGWSPIRIAREARRLAENLPVSASENITRTLQLHAYREATAAMERLNGQYIEKKVRIARLDDRTCAACIALHGTEMELGERVDDHYRGRCDSILIPVGGRLPETMQADSKPGERNFVPWQTGEEWFASLSPERQAQQASFQKSPAKLKAYKDGTRLSDFVGDHEDSVFGHQVIEKSLVNTVGDPEKYYVGSEGEN
jgi:hypothetical protein